MHAKSKENKNLALFDFDGTLCNKDSFTSFIFFALSKRHIFKQGLKTLPWIQAYFLNIYPAHSMRPKLFKSMFTGFSASTARKIAQEYSTSTLKHLNPVLLNQLRKHQLNGDDVAIVSASIDIYLKIIADKLDVKLICSETEIQNGVYTGLYRTEDCSGAQKRIRVKEVFKLNHYDAVYAYGNSEEDLAMLEIADFPYMVGQSETLPPISRQKKLA